VPCARQVEISQAFACASEACCLLSTPKTSQIFLQQLSPSRRSGLRDTKQNRSCIVIASRLYSGSQPSYGSRPYNNLVVSTRLLPYSDYWGTRITLSQLNHFPLLSEVFHLSEHLFESLETQSGRCDRSASIVHPDSTWVAGNTTLAAACRLATVCLLGGWVEHFGSATGRYEQPYVYIVRASPCRIFILHLSSRSCCPPYHHVHSNIAPSGKEHSLHSFFYSLTMPSFATIAGVLSPSIVLLASGLAVPRAHPNGQLKSRQTCELPTTYSWTDFGGPLAEPDNNWA